MWLRRFIEHYHAASSPYHAERRLGPLGISARDMAHYCIIWYHKTTREVTSLPLSLFSAVQETSQGEHTLTAFHSFIASEVGALGPTVFTIHTFSLIQGIQVATSVNPADEQTELCLQGVPDRALLRMLPQSSRASGSRCRAIERNSLTGYFLFATSWSPR